MAKKWTVTAVYPVGGNIGRSSDADAVLRTIAGPSDGSGSGCGERDHEWCGLTKARADRLVRSLSGLKDCIPGLRVSSRREE